MQSDLPKAQLARAGSQQLTKSVSFLGVCGPAATHNVVLAVYSCELLGYILCAVRTCVINNDDLPLEGATVSQLQGRTDSLLRERLCQQPDDDGQVAPLIVGRQDDAVLVGGHVYHVHAGDWIERWRFSNCQ